MTDRAGMLVVSARFENALKEILNAKRSPTVMEAPAGMMDGEPFDEGVLEQ
jgi:hypothetical protein